MRTLPNGDCLITHREYFSDVNAATNGPPTLFNNTSYPINPGQVTMFPWLSKIASNFESYEFTKLRFDYETDAATSLAGTVILAVDYDASDPPAQTKQQAQAYRGTVKSAPWQENSHVSAVEDLKKLKSHYVRPGLQPVNTDIKTYDIGTLQVITQGVSTLGALCGEMYVDYQVRLMTPVYENLAAQPGGSFAAGGSLSAANPFGTIPVPNASNSGILLNGLSVLYLQNPGTYLVAITATGTVLTADALAAGSGVTSTLLSYLVDGGALNSTSLWEVVSTTPGGLASYTQSATTITAASMYVATAPPGSL